MFFGALVQPNLHAQGDRALTLRGNVVRVLSGEGANTENGFGFIVSEHDAKIYIVTADHVVAGTPDAPNPSISVIFFADQGKPYKAVGLKHKTDHDLALLEVDLPPGFKWERQCLSTAQETKRGTAVWFIGRNGEWEAPATSGTIDSEKPDADSWLKAYMPQLTPGSSGGPLVTNTGIIAMVKAQSADDTRVLSIEYIKTAVQDWGYPWDLATGGTDNAVRSTPSEAKAEQRLESARHQRSMLPQFFQAMPKGGDLETHLSGSIPAESIVQLAVEAGDCVDPKDLFLSAPPCDAPAVPAINSLADPTLYRSMVDAFSMQNWKLSGQSGSDHFYSTFHKFGAATHGNTGKMLSETAVRAASQREIYQELMVTPTGKPFGDMLNAEAVKAIQLADYATPEILAAMRKALTQNGLTAAIQDAIRQTDDAEKVRDAQFSCGTPAASPGCQVTQRYLFQVLRGLPKQIVYAQILLGFELAQADPRFVGVSMAMQESNHVPMQDFPFQMRIFDFLHTVYPHVHISIPAGELNIASSGLAQSYHIRDAVEIGKADRIGHGTSLPYETNPDDIVKALREHNILVVTSLTSDDLILDIRGDDHPFRWYLRGGVPVALATSNEGVLRTSLTQEFVRAAETYGLSYGELKALARNSLAGSFLPGKDLWADPHKYDAVKECRGDVLGAAKPSISCSAFLHGSQKAALQWRLEGQFSEFEKNID
jgi:adenosine deaminase